MRLSDAHRAVESGWLALMGAVLAMVVAMAYEGLALRQKNGCHIPSLNPHCCHSEELENDLDMAAAIGADM